VLYRQAQYKRNQFVNSNKVFCHNSQNPAREKFGLKLYRKAKIYYFVSNIGDFRYNILIKARVNVTDLTSFNPRGV
jgi:hypothetical protein